LEFLEAKEEEAEEEEEGGEEKRSQKKVPSSCVCVLECERELSLGLKFESVLKCVSRSVFTLARSWQKSRQKSP